MCDARSGSCLPRCPPCAHLGAEALKHVPQDVGLDPGQQLLTGGLCRHMAVAQDQRALHFVYVIIAPVLGGWGQQASVTVSSLWPQPCVPYPSKGLPHKHRVSLEEGRAANNIGGLTDHQLRESTSIGSSRTSRI